MTAVHAPTATLSSRILRWLLPAVAVVMLVCLGLLLLTVRHAIDAALEHDEQARIEALLALIEVEPDGTVEVEAESWVTGGGAAPDVVFAVVREDDDRTLVRSTALDDDSAARLVGAPMGSQIDMGGRAHHVRITQFVARREEEAPGGAQGIACRLYTALDRSGYDARFEQIARTASAIVGLGLLLLLVVVPWIVRTGLGPLERLAEQLRRQHDRALTTLDAGGSREVSEVATAFNELAGRVEVSRERERRFVADAAHELRTPLAELRMIAEVGGDDPDLSEPRRRDYAELLAITERVTGLVEALLLLARSDARALTAACEEVDVTAVVRDAWPSAHEVAASRGVATHLHLDPVRSTCDAALLRVVVTNLLDNAARYGAAHGRVSVALRAQAHGFDLRVENVVADFDASDLEHMFDRFWRRDDARADGHAGLGLALARDAATTMGMTLDAELVEGAEQGGHRVLRMTLRGASTKSAAP